MAYDALKTEGGCPIVFNGANECAAELYFADRIGFTEIETCVQAALDQYKPREIDSIETIWEVDAFSRKAVSNYVERIGK